MKTRILLTSISAALLPAVTPLPQGAPSGANFQVRLSKQQQVRHALERLTFGPRPGDEDRLRRMGLKKWIDEQLHPDRIPENPVLAEKLRPLDSLSMTPEQIVVHYPPPQLVRAVADGRLRMPDDPLLRSAVERYRERVARKKSDGEEQSAGGPRPAGFLRDFFSPDQLRTLRRGTAEERRSVLASLPAGEVDPFAIALASHGGLRRPLFALAPVPVQRKMLLAVAPQQVVAYDLAAAKLYRAIYSNRQLQEELVDFWYNHFNVFLDKGADRYLAASYERDAIRPHVLGRFRDVLEATAKSPAMLFYLDNWQSVGVSQRNPRAARQARARGLNENYGRELMELHTVGVNGGYTQKDVIEVARCFTGWTIRNPRRGGGFYFNDRVHDRGEKIVLGVKIPAGGGIEDGERVLDILASRPATARFISTELAQRFVADNPPPELIDRMAKTYLSSGGDLRAVMKAMLTSREFWSEGAYEAKVKTPFEMVASSVRALDGDVESTALLVNQVAQLGEPLYRKIEPTGYSNLNADWVNSASLLARMNFALALTRNKLPGVRVDAAPSGTDDPDRIAASLLLAEPTAATRAALDKAAGRERPDPATLAGLVLGSPDFQKR